MKKFYSVIAAFSAAVIMWACGPAEIEYKQEFTLQGLYTVNKATVAPEFSDTMFFVRNIEDYDLKTGDRALLLLHYEYDAYNGKAAQWTIEEVLKRIPVYPLSLKSDINTDAYTTPITGLQPLNFFNAFKTTSWVWKGKQNLSIKYMGVEESASFALAVRGVNNGSVEMELFVDAEESDKEVATLLTFDISNIADFLSDADKASLPSNIDDIKTTVYVMRMSDGEPKEFPIKRDDIK